MYTDDGVFELGGRGSSGRASLREAYVGPMSTYQTMLHRVDGHVVQLTGNDSAVGILSGYTELTTSESAVAGVLRYDDDYRKVAGRWVVARRGVCCMYGSPIDSLAATLTSSHRVRWPGARPRAGDYPLPARAHEA